MIGSGAREHALCLALSADPLVTHLTCAPGNAGIATVAETVLVDVTDPAAVVACAEQTGAVLVVIGPEVPLVAGAADALAERGITCFGPTAAAAELEGSKSFAKEVMAAAGVPTARAITCTTGAEVTAALAQMSPPYVVKDDGLAAGKGVVVTDDLDEAQSHGVWCGRCVVEEYLDGPEVSIFCLSDGTDVMPLLPAQDFKRIGDDDTGPNTGGMGAYAPLDWVADDLVDVVLDSVARPTIAEMSRRGRPFSGVLYIGLALTAAGPRVVEFNARFGDPETQVVLALLETPLAGLLLACAQGELAAHPPLRWQSGAAVTVVVAAHGYPGTPRAGDAIGGTDVEGVLHAGTRLEGEHVVSAGGRVLSCTATGPDLATARDAAYALVDGITMAGEQHRTDIALRAVRGDVMLP